jgi:hypothetical protein
MTPQPSETAIMAPSTTEVKDTTDVDANNQNVKTFQRFALGYLLTNDRQSSLQLARKFNENLPKNSESITSDEAQKALEQLIEDTEKGEKPGVIFNNKIFEGTPRTYAVQQSL